MLVGPERGDSARKVARMLADVTWAESAGLATAWVPQLPSDFDALVAVALMGAATSRIELGTAVVPLQAHIDTALVDRVAEKLDRMKKRPHGPTPV